MTSRTDASSSTIRMRVGAARVSTNAILRGLQCLRDGARLPRGGRVDSRDGSLSSNSRAVPPEGLEGKRRFSAEDRLGQEFGSHWSQKNAVAEMSAGEEQAG